MRISDWSSDVCSSDLLERVAQHQILRFSVDRRALMRRRQPGPADLGATMAMIERTKTRAADDLPACDVDLHKWQGRTRVAGSQRHVDEMAHAFGRCGRIRIPRPDRRIARSEEQTTELQSLMRNSYADIGLKKKKQIK